MSKFLLVGAAVMGFITAFAIYRYLNTLSAPDAGPQEEVVVAATTIPAHTRITTEMLRVNSAPIGTVHPEALRDPASLVGGISRVEIVGGEQVLSSRVYTEASRAAFSYRIPDNMRAIAIPVNQVTGVAGYISTGDKVDVLVTYTEEEENGETITLTVFQNVRVLATGEIPQEIEETESIIVETVTLAVTPEQAEVLAYFYLNGSFHLTLRTPSDEAVEVLQTVTSANLNTLQGR